MPVVNILPAFGYSWAELGTAEPITDDQWKVGWSFIGAIPPSVDQFNKWGQIFDLKSNYLYAQLKAIYDLTGVIPSSVDGNSLRDALRGANLFQTVAAGTSDTRAATTAFVQANKGGSSRHTVSGSLVVPAGVMQMFLSASAGGGGGASGGGGGVGSFVGGGGGGGANGQNVYRQPIVVVPGQTINITIPAGGTGGTGNPGAGSNGTAGGSTIITNVNGGTLTLLGGNPGIGGTNSTNQTAGGAGGTATDSSQASGGYGADSTTPNASGDGGTGASGPYGSGGAGGPGRSTGGFAAQPAGGFGAGGGGGGGLYNGTAGSGNGGNGSNGMPGFAFFEW